MFLKSIKEVCKIFDGKLVRQIEPEVLHKIMARLLWFRLCVIWKFFIEDDKDMLEVKDAFYEGDLVKVSSAAIISCLLNSSYSEKRLFTLLKEGGAEQAYMRDMEKLDGSLDHESYLVNNGKVAILFILIFGKTISEWERVIEKVIRESLNVSMSPMDFLKSPKSDSIKEIVVNCEQKN
jgi:hypothetical protein